LKYENRARPERVWPKTGNFSVGLFHARANRRANRKTCPNKASTRYGLLPVERWSNSKIRTSVIRERVCVCVCVCVLTFVKPKRPWKGFADVDFRPETYRDGTADGRRDGAQRLTRTARFDTSHAPPLPFRPYSVYLCCRRRIRRNYNAPIPHTVNTRPRTVGVVLRGLLTSARAFLSLVPRTGRSLSVSAPAFPQTIYVPSFTRKYHIVLYIVRHPVR